MARFDYRQAEEIRDAFEARGVRYLFLETGAVLLGYPDTTQDANVFVDKSPGQGARIVQALRDLGFALTPEEAADVERGKDFVQLKKNLPQP